jgi:hypothetical protein
MTDPDITSMSRLTIKSPGVVDGVGVGVLVGKGV